MQRTYRSGEVENSSELPVYRLESHELGNADKVNFDVVSDWAPRPHDLHNLPRAFGLTVSDSKYQIFYVVGDVIFVHPTRPLSNECRVLVF